MRRGARRYVGRMKSILRIAAPALLAVTIFAACGDDDNGGSDTTAAPGTTASPGTTAAPSEVAITQFDLSDPSSCDNGMSSVTATYATTGVSEAGAVNFAVDGESPGAGAGYEPSGTADFPLPCDGASHEITISVGSGSDSKTESKSVTTPSS